MRGLRAVKRKYIKAMRARERARHDKRDQPPGAGWAACVAAGAVDTGALAGAPSATRLRFATLIAASVWLATATRSSASGCRYCFATRWTSSLVTAPINFG